MPALVTRSTPLSEVLSAQRAARHLAEQQIVTMADAQRMGLSKLASMKYVGPGSIAEIKEAMEQLGEPQQQPKPEPVAPVEELSPNASVEESSDPILLLARCQGLRVSWIPSHRVQFQDGTTAVQRPMFIEFTRGSARVTREMFLLRRYKRDQTKVDAAIARNEPWRVACARLLQSMRGFGREFFFVNG